MRGALLPLSILLALAATLGIVYVALQDPPVPQPAGEPDPAPDRDPPADPRPAELRLRRYSTTATLVEDLRDAVASDDSTLAKECWRVSAAIESRAIWALHHLVRQEASPRVRALLVLAVGAGIEQKDSLLDLLDDDFPVVREATVLAIGHAEKGAQRVRWADRIDVPVGGPISAAAESSLRHLYREEADERVRAAVDSVLRAAGLNRPQ